MSESSHVSPCASLPLRQFSVSLHFLILLSLVPVYFQCTNSKGTWLPPPKTPTLFYRASPTPDLRKFEFITSALMGLYYIYFDFVMFGFSIHTDVVKCC